MSIFCAIESLGHESSTSKKIKSSEIKALVTNHFLDKYTK